MKSHLLFATVATLLVVLGGVAVYDADGSDAATNLTIYFDGDGGSPVPSMITKTNDGSTNATVTIPSTVPTKSGYKFLYWVEADEGETPIYPGTSETFPWGPWTLVAVYEAQTTYTVTFNANNGGKVSQTSLTVPAGTTITESGNQLIFKDGDNLVGTVTATANDHYKFANWFSLKDLTTVNSDMTISAIFVGETVTITIKAGTGGTVSDPYIVSTYGTKVTTSGNTLTIGTKTVTATPASGYSFSSWSSVPSTVTGATTITANFTKSATVYDFEVDINLAGGSASFKLNWTWTSTDNPDTFHVPDEVPTKSGYKFVEYTTVTEAGTEHLQPGDDLDMLSDWSVLTLTAVWERVTYTVTINASDGGTVNKSSITGVPAGSKITISGNTLTINGTTVTATPNAHYKFASWTSIKDLDAVNSDMTISAIFTKELLNVSIKASTGGTVSNNILVVPYGSTISTSGNTLTINGTTVTATPNSHYHFVKWSQTSGTITSNTTITANFAIDTYTVTISAGSNGTVDKTSVIIGYGTTWTSSGNVLTFSDGQKVTATPASGYSFSSWSQTSGTITTNTTITANFAMVVYDFEVDINLAGGSASFNLNWTWSSTDNPDTFHVPDEVPTKSGYKFVEYTTVTEAGTEHLQPGDDLDMLSEWSVLTLTAVWGSPYTVTISAGTGGSVDTTRVSVYNGTTFSVSDNVLTFSDGQTVTAVPNAGYHFVDWSPASGTITSNLTITATFAIDTYTVTISAGTGGTVSPTTVDVPHNSAISASGNILTIGNQRITATPDGGYAFSAWSQTSGTITGATTITATFERVEVTYIVTYDANGGSGAPVGVSATTYDLSWSFTIPDSEPRRSGYTFGGWEAVYNGSASGTVYNPGDTVTLSAVLSEVVLKAKWTPVSSGDAFTIYASADGWVYDGKTYAYDTVTLFYSETDPIYIDGKEYAGGHIYLQLGNRGTVLDLGVSSPDFEIKLGGQWAVSTALSAGESSTTTKTEMKPWGWNWDMSLVAIAFVGILALATVVANYLTPSGLRPMDWIVIGIAGVVGVALMVL